MYQAVCTHWDKPKYLPPLQQSMAASLRKITQGTNPNTAPVHSPKQFGGKEDSSRYACTAHTQQSEMLPHLNRPLKGPRQSFTSSIHLSPWMSFKNYEEVGGSMLTLMGFRESFNGSTYLVDCSTVGGSGSFHELPSIYPDVLLPIPTGITSFELLLPDYRKGPPTSVRPTST